MFAGYASGTAPDRYGQLKLVRSTDIKGGTYDGYKPDSSFNLWRVAPHYSLMEFVDAIRVQNDGTNNYITPITNNATDLGTSSNQWKSVYSQTYYYNGTQWGLDKLNVWTSNQYIVHASTPKFLLKDVRNDRTYTVTDKTGGIMRWECLDKDSDPLSRISTTFRGDKAVQLQFSIFNEDSTGTEFERTLRLVADRDPTSPALFYPEQTDTVNLGTSTNQWNKVYSKAYYYNGTQWGLDVANEWTKTQTYPSVNYGELIRLKNTGLDLSVAGNTGLSTTYQHLIHWVDNNNTPYSTIQSWTNNSENILVLRSRYRTDANTVRTSSVRNRCTADTKSWYPETNGDTDLGTSTNKWKTLNGVNPGALSLPSSSYVEIDTTNWDKTGATSQSYTPTVHGWLYISIQNIAGNYLSVSGGRGAISMDGTGVQSGLRAMLPVIANESVSITVKTGSIFAARFYPCLGNV